MSVLIPNKCIQANTSHKFIKHLRLSIMFVFKRNFFILLPFPYPFDNMSETVNKSKTLSK